MRGYFKKSTVLLPRDADMRKWSVVACDQYPAEPEYWDEVDSCVGDAPSTLRITLPEIFLEQDGVGERIQGINSAMRRYLDGGLFTAVDGYIYCERTLSNGRVRKGLIGVCDLEAYDFTRHSKSPIRATEGTIFERIPPRLAVRNDAPLESPHIMMLIDDPERSVIEPLENATGLETLYDFDLMMSGGHLTGKLVPPEYEQSVDLALARLGDSDVFEKKYDVTGEAPLVLAAGDGNHSLATAKTCYENLKKTLPPEELENHPARYALCELVNIHDEALEFTAIHRVVFETDPEELVTAFKDAHELSADGKGQRIDFIYASRQETVFVSNGTSNIAVGTLQNFLDSYLKEHSGRTDYIHGEDVVRELAEKDGCLGILLPDMRKDELFKTVITDSALPRKTFSMGHANDKRFYLECREIK